MERPDVRRQLEDGAVVEVGPPLGAGAHPPCRIVLEGGLIALAKFPSLAREDDGRLMVVRERAAWIVAEALGWADLVPRTVLRELPAPAGGVEQASLQAFVQDAEMAPLLSELLDDQIMRAAVFDIVIHTSDRVANWMGVRESEGTRLVLIDHGHAFEMPRWGGIRSVFVRAREGTPLRDAHRLALEGLVRHDGVRSELQALLTSEPVSRMMARVEKLLQRSTVTRS